MREREQTELKRFWRAYLDTSVPTTIVYTRNLFYHDRAMRYFIRHVDTNKDKENLKDKLDKDGTFLPANCFPNSRHYVAFGDAKCVFALTGFFQRHQVHTRAVASYETAAWRSKESRQNLIWLGNKRTFQQISATLREWEFDFQIEDQVIEDVRHKRQYHDEDGKVDGKVYGIVSRAFDRRWRTNVTILAGNTGSFFEGAGNFLVHEDTAAELNERLGARHKALPAFELLLEVTVENKDLVSSSANVSLADGPREHSDNERRTSERVSVAVGQPLPRHQIAAERIPSDLSSPHAKAAPRGYVSHLFKDLPGGLVVNVIWSLLSIVGAMLVAFFTHSLNRWEQVGMIAVVLLVIELAIIIYVVGVRGRNRAQQTLPPAQEREA